MIPGFGGDLIAHAYLEEQLALLDNGGRAPIERRLLALLATGAADDTIARTLGISRRTFFRYLERLMNRTGASTRFQLALHAARENWL